MISISCEGKNPLSIYIVLLYRFLLILNFLALSRFFLFWINTDKFEGVETAELVAVALAGYKFDVSVLCLYFIVNVVFNSLPFSFVHTKLSQRIIDVVTLFVTSFLLVVNLSDAVYYRFTLRRSTADIFTFLGANSDFFALIPQFFVDFWFVPFLVIIGIFLLIKLYHLLLMPVVSFGGLYTRLVHLFVGLLIAGLCVLGIRGGTGETQLKPLGIADASRYAPAPLIPLVLNTPFSIIRSFGKQNLELLSYFKDDEIEQIFSPVQQTDSIGNRSNVVILILESFSSEHIGYLSGDKTYTPFLDSLFDHSLVVPTIANGKRSVEGIPAILSGIPSAYKTSFSESIYTSNAIEGVAKTLKESGYSTAFYHGGKNGTMNFDSYALAAGFDSYYGLNEFPDKSADMKSLWGVWDEPYLQYFAEQLGSMSSPFLATCFTLSSHHPYKVPEQYEGKFKQGDIPIQEVIGYTDYALKQFFEKAQQMPWYENTLFVITADHTSEAASSAFNRPYGRYRIPLAFFHPTDTILVDAQARPLAQQTDIYPSIVDYVGIEADFVAFGASVFDTSAPSFAVNRFSDVRQLFTDSLLLQYRQDEIAGVYDYTSDFLLQYNLMDSTASFPSDSFVNGYLQQYNNRMIRNELTIE